MILCDSPSRIISTSLVSKLSVVSSLESLSTKKLSIWILFEEIEQGVPQTFHATKTNNFEFIISDGTRMKAKGRTVVTVRN